MKYHLMNKNLLIGKFELVERYGNKIATGVELYKITPFELGNMHKWLEHRQAAKHRQHIKELMVQCGCDTIERFIRVTHCTSVNDTLWVKREDEDITWERVSLYTNEFDEVIAKLAFEGVGIYGQEFSLTTPEFGTNGTYSKCITREYDGSLVMYKRGTDGFANSGLEPYGEYLSSELYNIITDGRSVQYDLVKLHSKVASKCRIFTTEH